MQYSFVYILSNKNNSVLYIGVTSDLIKRVYEHKSKIGDSFTSRYSCTKLVYFETFENIEEAIVREKKLKGWKRERKEALIDKENSLRNDLYEIII